MKNILFFFLIVFSFSCTHKRESMISSHPKTEDLAKVENIIIEKDTTDFIEERDTIYFAKAKFDYYEFDAGDVPEGPDIEYEFPFTNIGTCPLVISSCKSSCGCVVPICENRFVLPGESGVFKAKYITKGHSGYTRKTITMAANTEPKRTVLRLEANIIPAEKD